MFAFFPSSFLPELELAVAVPDGGGGHARRRFVLVEERVGHLQVLAVAKNDRGEEDDRSSGNGGKGGDEKEDGQVERHKRAWQAGERLA